MSQLDLMLVNLTESDSYIFYPSIILGQIKVKYFILPSLFTLSSDPIPTLLATVVYSELLFPPNLPNTDVLFYRVFFLSFSLSWDALPILLKSVRIVRL